MNDLYYILNKYNNYKIILDDKEDLIKYNGYNFKMYSFNDEDVIKKLDELLFYYKLKGHEINFEKTYTLAGSYYKLHVNDFILQANYVFDTLNIEEIKNIDQIIESNFDRYINYDFYIDATYFFNYSDADKCMENLYHDYGTIEKF